LSKLIPQKLIPFGKFIKPHGIKGELKLLLYNKDSNILSNKIKIWVNLNDELYYYSVESIKGTKDLIVKFSQINDRDQANLLSGQEFFISRENFPDLDKRNFYLVDIIKFKVFDEKKEIGFISDILSLPGGNVIEINFKKKMILVPMVDKYIKFFDFDNKIIIMKNINEFIKL